MKCVDHCAAQDAGLGVRLSVRGMRHRLDSLGGVETNKSWIRVCLASEREGEPRANDQVIFMWMNIYSEIVIQVAYSQQERRPGSSPSYRPGAGVPAQLRVARLPLRQQASAVINFNSSKVGGVVW